MSTAIQKTDTEVAIAEAFDRLAGKLPGGRAVSAVRREAMARFRERGLPHRRVEEWKYTDLRALLNAPIPLGVTDDTNVSLKSATAALGPFAALDAHRVVFVNGQFRPELSGRGTTIGFEVLSFATALKGMADADAARLLKPLGPETESIAALNSALASDGAIVSIQGEVEKPILLVHLEAGASAARTVRHSIGVLPGAKATVVELYLTVDGATAGQLNAASEVAVGAKAELNHVRVVHGAGTHVASIAPTIEASATYRLFDYVSQSALVRSQSFPTLIGEHATLDVSGLMLGRGRAHMDLTFVVDHAVPHCTGRQLVKAVLDDSARAVCQGKVIVRPDAQKTDGKQMAQALMLSDRAEFDSKPELEIYADDVVCGHGATVAEVDPQQLFYLRARGIPQDEARALLIESFIGEAIERVEDELVRGALLSMATTWLRG
jgi:Fe-S cluster assembly protein SufD